MSCPECFSGHVSGDTPIGREAIIHGRNTYVAEPSSESPVKGLLIIVPDAFGWQFVNTRILADHYASKGGYRVYLPDVMDGKSAPVWMMSTFAGLLGTGSVKAWLWKPYYFVQAIAGFLPFFISNSFSISMPKVKMFAEAVRSSEGISLPIGCAGFCWGGRHAITLAHAGNVVNGKPLVDVVFAGHPSGLAIPGEIEKIAQPVAIAVGDKDAVVGLAQVEKIKKVIGKIGVESEVKIYPGAGHGFCTRGDPLNAHQVQQSLEAEEQAIKWFSRHFEMVRS